MQFAELKEQIEERRQAAGVPGVALAVIQGNQIIHTAGFGTTSVEDGAGPITPQTLFRIASTTKPLTGTAVMRLVERGGLDLDRAIRDYIPWIAFSRPGTGERLTLRLLLSHRGGLPFDYQLAGSRDPSALEAYVQEEIPRLPLPFPPGETWHYSNAGINLAGHLVEAAYGRPFANAMQDLVFEPLGMRHTTFDPTVAMTYPLAQSHEIDGEGRLRVEHRSWDRVAGYPAGGAFSTVVDLAQFAIMHLNAGRFRGAEILSPASVREMHTPQSELQTSTGKGFGLTFFVEEYQGIRRVEHWGGVNSFSSRFVLAPDARVGVVVLHNRMASAFDADEIVDAVFDQLLDLPVL